MRLSVATRAKVALTTAIAIAAAYYATADPPRAFYILHRHADAIRAVLADDRDCRDLVDTIKALVPA